MIAEKSKIIIIGTAISGLKYAKKVLQLKLDAEIIVIENDENIIPDSFGLKSNLREFELPEIITTIIPENKGWKKSYKYHK